MYWFYKTMQFIVLPVLLLFFDVTYKGKENVPKNGHFVIMSNHRSNLDPMLLSWHVPGFIRFMGKKELFSPAIAWFTKGIGGFAIDRGAADMEALNKAVGFYNAGQSVGLFPEGTRSETNIPLRPKSGAIIIAVSAKADVLPCAVSYQGKIGFRSKVTIEYGKVIPYESYAPETDSPRELKKAIKLVWGEVLKMLGVEE